MRLIDPKRLIMHLNDWMFAEGCEEGWNYDKNKVVPDHERQQAICDTIQQCIDAVFDQPTVDVKPVRHGKGVIAKESRMTVWLECSVCHKPIDVEDKYCRHCGAKMDGGDL